MGIILGVVAVLVALPPFELRQLWWPAAIGIVGTAAGIWATTRAERRVGLIAIAVNILGVTLGILATESSTENLNIVFRPDLEDPDPDETGDMWPLPHLSQKNLNW